MTRLEEILGLYGVSFVLLHLLPCTSQLERERERERERDAYFSPAVAPDISGEDEELLQIAQSFSLWTPQEEEDPGLPGAATRLSQTTARNGSSRNESSLFRNEKRETKTETDVPGERERERERERDVPCSVKDVPRLVLWRRLMVAVCTDFSDFCCRF